MRVYTTEDIGPRRGYTPEGYLSCFDVPIARTGEQEYHSSEVGLDGDAGGVVRVQRDPEEVFRPETVASFEGKDVLNDHPADGQLIGPSTWREHSVGTVHNVRRGEGDQADLLLADLVVKDPRAIQDVLDGKRQVSAGYDCSYEQTGAGRGRQVGIVGNHVALVDRARCGERCSIGDSASTSGSILNMAITTKPRGRISRFLDRALKARAANDAEEMERLREEAAEHDAFETSEPAGETEPDTGGEGGDHVHVHIHKPDDDRLPPADEEGGNRADPDMGDVAEMKQQLATLTAEVQGIKQLLGDLADAEAEEAELQGQEEEGEEVADRRVAVGDRKRRVRDAMRGWHDQNLEPLAHDPDAEGEVDLMGTGPGGQGASQLNTGDRARRRAADGSRRTVTTDSSAPAIRERFDRVVSQAEILSPGIRLPTFDARVAAANTEERICGLRRRSLDAAYRTPAGRAAIDEVLGGRSFNLRTATCDQVTPVFNAAAALVQGENRRAVSDAVVHAITPAASATTIASLNEKYREMYKPRWQQ